jgi:hypothetical protein
MNVRQHNILLALGLPDDRTAKSFVDAQGRPQFSVPNQLKLPDDILASIKSEDQIIWFPKKDSIGLTVDRPIVNCCADFDTYRMTLSNMIDRLPKDAVVFNHPAAIAHSASQQLRDALAKIEGLRVPKLIRVTPKKPDDIRRAVQMAGLHSPLRIQFAQNQSNRPEAIIRSDEDWTAVEALDWPGKAFIVTELTKRDLAQHVRIRLSVVGGEVNQVMFQFSYGQTLLPNEIAPRLDMQPALFNAIFVQMARRVMLDAWTAELSFRGASDVTLEYLWPALPFPEKASAQDPSHVLWDITSSRLTKILSAPEKWRSAARFATKRPH